MYDMYGPWPKSNCVLLLTFAHLFIYIHLSSTIEINFIQETSSKTTAAHRRVCPTFTTRFGQFFFSVSFYAFGCEFLLPIQLIEWSHWRWQWLCLMMVTFAHIFSQKNFSIRSNTNLICLAANCSWRRLNSFLWGIFWFGTIFLIFQFDERIRFAVGLIVFALTVYGCCCLARFESQALI